MSNELSEPNFPGRPNIPGTPRIPNTIGPRIYVVVERIAKQAYRARTLPPFKVDEMGSNERRLVERVKEILPKYFRKLTPANWARPMPGNNSQLAPPTILTLQIPLKIQEMKFDHELTVDIDVVHWQVDEKNQCYFAPVLDRTLIGRPQQWEGEPMVREFRAEIERRIKDGGLAFVSDWLMDKKVTVHQLKFPAITITQETKSGKPKKVQLPTLKKTSSDVRTWSREPVFERDVLVDQVAALLTSDVPQSVLLVGEPGIGKTAIVQHLPSRNAKLPPLWSTSGSQLVSGMCGWGMWQEQLQKLLVELRKIQGILHVGSLQELVEAGKIDDQPGVASFLKPEMQRGRIRVVAECTPEQYQKLESQDPALVRCFMRIDVEELAVAINQRLLQQAAEKMLAVRQNELIIEGYELRIGIESGVVESLDALCRRYCGYSAMPGMPLRMLRSTIGTLQSGEHVTAGKMMQAFSAHTGLPRFLIDDQVPLDYEDLKQRMAQRVVGQREPVELIANMVTTLKSRLQRPEKPLASFLFIGPTGVGKTEMAKLLAEVLFGNGNRIVRLDMSEYATPWSLGRLTGMSAQDSGTLTGPILDQPFSLVLLDEIEKAHPSVFDLLLQVLGEGRLTDTAGRRADFRSAVIVMTSNLGVESFKAIGTGFGGGSANDYREHFEREVRRYVRPELLGRLDRIVPFATLSLEDVRRIARRELEKLWQRPGILYGKWKIQVTDELVDWIVNVGYQPQYGARPLRRAVEEWVAIPLSRYLVDAESAYRDSAGPKSISLGLRDKIVVVSELADEPEIADSAVESSANERKISATELDGWRALRHKALLTQHGPDMRTTIGLLDRVDRQLADIEKKLKKCFEPVRHSALIHSQGMALATRKQIATRLHNVEEAIAKIVGKYPGLLRAFLDGTSVAGTSTMTHLETELKTALVELDTEKERTSDWTFLYLGGPINEYKFLIECHAQRFRAKQIFWLLYDSKKFTKLKKEEKLTNPYKDADLKMWSDADIVAGRNTKSLGEVSLDHAIGLAFEALPNRQNALFIEEEYGVHFLKRKDGDTIHKHKLRVHLFPSGVEAIHLPSGFREMQFPSELDPVRQYLQPESRVVHVPSEQSVIIGGGTMAAAVQRLLDRIQDEAVWSRIGFKPLPDASQATNKLF